MKKSVSILVMVCATVYMLDYHLSELSYAETKLFYFAFIAAFLFLASICFVGLLRSLHTLTRFTLLILLFAVYLFAVHIHMRSVLWKQHLATPLTESEVRIILSKLPCGYNRKDNTISVSRCRRKELQDVLFSLSNISQSSHEDAAESSGLNATNSSDQSRP